MSPRYPRLRVTAVLVAVVTLCVAAIGGGVARSVAPTVQATAGRPAKTVAALPRQWMEMRHVDVRIADSATVRVRWLRGELLRTAIDRPVALGDPLTFRVRVTGGTVSLTGADLGAIENGVLFAYHGAPLSDLRLRTNGSELVQTGVLHKVVPLHFETRATLTLMPDGRIRVHPIAVHVLGLSAEKLLHTLGMHLSSVVDVSHARGIALDGDDVIIDPMQVLPPPAIVGRLRAVRIEGPAVIAEFLPSADDTLFRHSRDSAHTAPGFVDFHGGTLEVGTLEMHETDLRIGDRDSLGSFDLSLPHYADQLMHGYFTMHANFGVVARVPDFAALGMAPASAPPIIAGGRGR
jgi:hypothetical protein